MAITWGYVRVSTDDQGSGLAAQRAVVVAAGVDERHIRTDDGVSGMVFDRPALNSLLTEMQKGDVLVIHKMDRLGRSVRGVLNLIEEIRVRGIELRFLHEQIDTTTAHGKFFFVVMLAMAEMERNMISDRTKTALAEIKRTGIGKLGKPVKVGRPTKLSNDDVATIRAAVADRTPIAKLARQYGVSRGTIYNCVDNTSETGTIV